MMTVWTTTTSGTSVSTPNPRSNETPVVSLQREPLYPVSTTQAMRKVPHQTTPQTLRHPRRIPRTVIYHPPVTTTTAPISTVEFDIREIVCSKDWDCDEAMHVAYCESRLNPAAISPTNSNGTRDWGLMQINDVWRQAFPVSWRNVLEAKTNVDMAWHIYQTAGNSWQPWTCKP